VSKNKAFIVTLTGYGDDEGFEVVYATLDKAKTDDILRLWDIVQNNQHKCYGNKPEKNPMCIALKELQDKYHIITWSGRDLKVEELDLQ